ncbi:MAG: hypothetical protein WCP35_12005 [Verrucomicrobiota bacterium]
MGGGGGPSYVTQASIAAKNRAKAWLETSFTITPGPPVNGWVLGTERLIIP